MLLIWCFGVGCLLFGGLVIVCFVIFSGWWFMYYGVFCWCFFGLGFCCGFVVGLGLDGFGGGGCL